MRKIAILFLLLALAFAQEVKEIELEVIQDEVVLEAGIEDYIEIIKCLISNEKLVDEVMSLVEIVKTGEFEKLLPLLLQLYTDGKEAIDKCITPEIILERHCTIHYGRKFC